MSTGQRQRQRLHAPKPPAAEPTRRTLVFPSVEVPRSRRFAPPLPSVHVHVPASRASERPTLKTLPPFDEPSSGHGNTEVIELSTSALDSDVSMLDVDGELGSCPGGRSWCARGAAMAARAVESSKTFLALVVARRALGHVALGAVGTAIAFGISPGGAASLGEQATGVSDMLRPRAREAHRPASQHTPLAARATVHEGSAPRGECATSGASRVLSTRAHLPPGLDVSVLDGGFGVGFASSTNDALGVRLDGQPLRVTERVRVRARAGSGMRHVAVEAPRHEDDTLDLRVEADEARTVVPEGDAPAFRMAVLGGWILLTEAGKRGARTLWPVPGGGAKAKSRMALRVAGAAASAGTTAGTLEVAPDLRVAAREDGGAVVALRRPSALWLGLVDAQLTADGPLVPMTRPGAVLGMPSVAPSGGGGVVAWAERTAGEREWRVMVATFSGGADSGRSPPVIRPIAAGMSPSIASLPGGDLLLAHAVGASGSHRVIVRRLGRDLEARGEPVVVSPDAVNAGQPATAVAPDGRALVAFFGAERGHPSSVLATPLSCSLGL